MEDNKSKITKEQKEILLGLFSTNEVAVLESIEKIRDKGGDYSIKPLLEIYFSTPYVAVRNSVYELICDLKDSKIAEILEQNIETYQNKEHLPKFLSALWQSAVKFSNLMPFLRIFDNGDELIAVEILSVVEQSAGSVSDAEREECLKFIKSKISDYQGFKKTLAEEILELLK